MRRGQFPKNTFGTHVAKAAGYTALGSAAMTADAGNPLVNLATGAVIGAGVGAVHHIVKSVRAANDEIRYQKRVDEVKAIREQRRNQNLGRQFK